MPEAVADLIALAMRHAKTTTLPISRLRILTQGNRTKPSPSIYEPVAYFVLRGKKRISFGERFLEYGAGSLMVASIDLPVMWQVIDASPSAPYLAVSLELDRATVASLLIEMPPVAEQATSGIVIGPQSKESIDALFQLMRLLDTPADIPVLAPLAERMLLYRVLQSSQGALVREFARTGGRLTQVSRAVAWIRGNVTEPLRVDELSDIAGTSRTSLHRHFKNVTGMSPLAYQKALRLQEARYRLVTQPGDVAGVAFAVGYESVSQFSREYARQFGAPPSRDAARLRAIVEWGEEPEPRSSLGRASR